jgi:AICAR transformylase/IMP cyclohydrolase PurH
MFYEIVIAPGYTPEGLETLKGKSKNLRILEAKPRAPSGLSLRQVRRLQTEESTLVTGQSWISFLALCVEARVG